MSPNSAGPQRVTALDVAKRAGVSQPTVSLVLSRNPNARVAPATRQRVLDAAEELGYRPNVLARALVRRRSFSLGLVVPDLRNPFFAEVVSGAERVAREAGYAVLLTEMPDAADLRPLEALRQRQIDGVIMDAVGAAAAPADALADLNVVLVDEPSERWPGVASDALGAGRMAAEHLLALGHREVAFVGPALGVHTFRMRERGFAKAMRDAGAPLTSERLRRAPATAAGGQAAMRALLAPAAGPAGRARPTGVFCANDLVAIGALKACAAAGLRVPQDVSIVGCDDIEMARLVTPELTTVAVPARELGARAARMLIRSLDATDEERARLTASRPVPVRLVVRGSTAPAPAAAEPAP